MTTRRDFVATTIAAIASVTVASAQTHGNGFGAASNKGSALPATVSTNTQYQQEDREGSPMKDLAEDPRITRARLSGPEHVTKDATVAVMGAGGTMTVLLKGTNEWVCVPGDENKIGAPPMCMNPMGMRWMLDAMQGKPAPTNTAPGAIYMLCGATQRSNTDPLDRTSPALPIGPHWMITWPFDAEAFGLPPTKRDKGAWMMFAGTPYAYLHVCGTPWDGEEYQAGDKAVWTMSYERPRS
jgi:hypothetical protein